MAKSDSGNPASGAAAGASGAKRKAGQYDLMALPYDLAALEPVIDRQTVEIHHDKHHAAYVKEANRILDELKSAAEAPKIKALLLGLAFNASGVVLHELYWQSLNPKGQKEPSGDLADQINSDFGSLEACKVQFAAAAKTAEGSGWSVLAWEPSIRKLVVLQVEKHQNLTIWGCAPLMVCDVWEHAYYLKYQNRRPDYVDALMGILDWRAASEKFRSMKSTG